MNIILDKNMAPENPRQVDGICIIPSSRDSQVGKEHKFRDPGERNFLKRIFFGTKLDHVKLDP
jgi:hypothetical protein